jgi:hypothetical protein
MILDAIDLGMRAARFDASAFAEVFSQPGAAGLAYLVLLLSALMLAISQSVVLFANKVPPVRFLFALMIAGFQYAVSAIAYGLGFVAAARALGVEAAGPGGVLALVALSWAPYLFSPISLVPHFGLGWQRLLEAWVAALMVLALAVGLGVSLPYAVALGALGWAIGHGAHLLVGPLLGNISWRLLEFATGRKLEVEVDPAAVIRDHAAQIDPSGRRP